MKRRLVAWALGVAVVLPLACSSVPQHTAPITSATVQPPTAADSVSIRIDGRVWQGDDLLPFDPVILVDTLGNGVRLYARKNTRPETRAELRLVVDAGSVLEDDDQLGLAHFVEHMAFNGTERFEKQALIDYMERHGMRFGADLNAYTSFDETVYMLTIPTDTLEVIAQGIRILRDWAGSVSFEDEEIDKERGVVTEEWRQGRGANARMLDEQLPVLLSGSRYADRLPIGDPEIIRNAEYEVVKRFYRDWYRPDLMAVIAIGDFDPEVVMGMMREEFKNLPGRITPRPRGRFNVPGHPETLIAPATDPEAPYGTVNIVFKRKASAEGTVNAYRDDLVEGLYHSMFNERLGELTQQSDPPFAFASSGDGGFVRDADFYMLRALVREGGAKRGLEVMLTEAERVRRHGFTAGELTRQKDNLLRYYERAYAERDKSESGRFAAEYTRNFLEREPVPGIAFEYGMVEQLLPTVSVDEINALSNRLITRENRVVLLDGPDSAPLPDSAEIIQIFQSVRDSTIDPYDDVVLDAPLVPEPPSPGMIVSEERDDSLGVTRLTLSNGAHVVLKPTDFKNDQILFSASSPGGTSLYPDSLYTAAATSATVIEQSGLGEFGPIELNKKLSGIVASVSPTIGSLAEGLSGSASPKDLETLFELIYLTFTAPRADSVSFESYRIRVRELISSMRASPEKAYRDTIQVTMAQGHYRAQPFDEDRLDEMDLQASLEIYNDRFEDAGDFRFYFVGAFSEAEIRPLIERYLASLPATDREETWRDVGMRPPTGIVRKTVRKGIEPKSQVRITMTGPFEWTRPNRQAVVALTEVMRLKFREVLREDLGGTYGVSISGSSFDRPHAGYSISIGFGCDPERVDELIATTFSEIDKLRADGIDASYIQKVAETARRGLEENLRENNYWLQSLEFVDTYDQDPYNILSGSNEYYAQLTPGQIRDAARTYLDTDNYALFILLPEESADAAQ